MAMMDMNGKAGVHGDERIPLSTKLGYGIGDFGANLAFLTTLFYLLYFFTDVFGIEAKVAGIIVLASKSWDAVSDPLMGTISDRTKSRWGKKRPYLLFGALPVGIAFMLLFYSPQFGGSEEVIARYRIIWGVLTYILFCTTITVVNVPYAALTAAMTRDSHERSVITGYRMSFGIVGTLVAAGATLPLVGLFGGDDPIAGFRTLGMCYGAVLTVVTLIAFGATRETVTDVTIDVGTQMRPYEYVLTVVKNRPFMILLVGTLMYMLAMNTLAAVVAYYFKYNLKAENLIAFANMGIFIPALFSIPLFVSIGKKASKKLAYNLGMGTVGAMLVVLFFFAEKSLVLTFICLAVAGMGLSTNWLSPWAIIPDTVEYSEWKLGIRNEGILYGVFFFVFKLGAALAGFLVGRVLDFVGYMANQPQTDQSLLGIRLLFTLFPVCFIILGITIMSFFPIDAKRHREMIDEIEKQRV
ncbi:MAG: MFS transporter [Deltaproteobacteria bacterium]|nr:MFS transporter [Candidatus Zymogenaceae bacterium]